MSINKDIRQVKFENSFHKAVANLYFTSNWLRDKETPIYKKFGLQRQHFNVLKIIKGQDPKAVSPGDILEVMLDKKRDLTRLIDKMVQMELLKRELCPTNRRKVDITITKKGIQVVEDMTVEVMSLFNELSCLTEAEAEELSRILDKIRS